VTPPNTGDRVRLGTLQASSTLSNEIDAVRRVRSDGVRAAIDHALTEEE
jgi:hypothetical protein